MLIKDMLQEYNTMTKEITMTLAALFQKGPALGVFLAPLLGLLSPISTIIYVMLFLVVVDNITGMMKTFNEEGKKFCSPCIDTFRHIKSRLLGKTIMKVFAYLVSIIAGFLIDKFILPQTDEVILTRVVAVSIAFREFISILENLRFITGGGILGVMINILKYGTKDGLGRAIEQIKEEDGHIKRND